MYTADSEVNDDKKGNITQNKPDFLINDILCFITTASKSKTFFIIYLIHVWHFMSVKK